MTPSTPDYDATCALHCWIISWDGWLCAPPAPAISRSLRERSRAFTSAIVSRSNVAMAIPMRKERRFPPRRERWGLRAEDTMIDYHQLALEMHLPEQELQEQAGILLLLRFFAEGQLSSGQAARLLGVTRGEFQTLCFQYHIPIDDPFADPVNEAGYTL